MEVRQANEGQVLVTGLEVDEPVFVLRARDAATLSMVAAYRAMQLPNFDTERLASLDALQRRIREWRREHPIRDAD